MRIPQVLLCAILFAGVLVNFIEHGKEHTQRHSLWRSLFRTVLWLGLLWWGGFF